MFRAYDTSKLYRDLKLRGAVIRDKELIQLPNEQASPPPLPPAPPPESHRLTRAAQIFNKLSGIWNLSADQARAISPGCPL